MKLKQTLLGLGAIVTIFGGALVSAPAAQALECSVLPDFICAAADNTTLETSGTWLLLIFVINVVSAGVGFVAVAMIAYAGFKYATAQSNESQTKESKEMIRNVVIGIAVYALMWAGIQWLVPGGIFK